MSKTHSSEEVKPQMIVTVEVDSCSREDVIEKSHCIYLISVISLYIN